MICRRAILVGAVAALLTGCGGHGATKPTSSSTSTLGKPAPCGRTPPHRASYSHVIWVWMENQSYDQVAGSSSAPYLNSLARACGLATNYHGHAATQKAPLEIVPA